MRISFSETVGWGCPRVSVSGYSMEQGLHPSPLALTSDGKAPAGSHLMLGGYHGVILSEDSFSKKVGGCASVLGSASAGQPLVILGTYRSSSLRGHWQLPCPPTSFHPS